MTEKRERADGGRFELRDHTADVAVEATGDSLAAVFAAVADGLAAASCDEIPDEEGERFSFSVTAEGREALLFDYLDELVYLRDVRAELPVDHRVAAIDGPDSGASEGSATAGADIDDANGADIDDANDADAEDGENSEDGDWTLEASARGVPLTEIDAREIKAVTYSEMRLERRGDGDADGDSEEWEAYVVFDV